MRTRKFKRGVMWACTGVAVLVAAVTAIDIMIPSYYDWKEYYDAAIAEREEQKYLNSLPFEFLGISATLADGVEYYKNGKAAPENEDLRVIAHFTEKGKDFDEVLRSGDFEISYPDSFAQSGGNITVSYSYTPEAEGDEEPQPIVKTAEVAVTLSDVLPVSLSITELRYRVAYAAGATFDMSGISGEVGYNDGSVLAVTAKDLTTTVTTLAEGVNSVDVTWQNGGEELTAAVPVSVSADYTDGKVVSLAQDGPFYLEQGELLAEAQPKIRAVYENGNRLPISAEDYTVKGNVERASFNKNCILTVTANSNPLAWCRFAARVSSGMEAEALEDFSGSATEVDSVSEQDGEWITEGKVSGVALNAGDVLDFTVSSETVSKPEFVLNLSNRSLVTEGENVVAQDIKLADIFSLEVNGRAVDIPESAVLHGYAMPAAESAGYQFEQCALPSVVLNKTAPNSVKLTVRDGATGVFIDRISLETGYTGKFYSSVDDLLAENAAAGTTPALNSVSLRNWGVVTSLEDGKTTLGAYGHGMCTDGTYIYMVSTSYSDSLRRAVVAKIDPATGEILATSQRTPVGMTTEDYAGITYYDGNIIIFDDAGGAYFTAASNFVDGTSSAAFWTYKDFDFEDLGGVPLKDVGYSAENNMFAVLTGSNVKLFDAEKNFVNDISISTDEGKVKRMTATDKYIYVLTSGDGIYNANLYIADWQGNFIGKITIDTSVALTDTNTSKSSVQGVCVRGNDVYIALVSWGQDGRGDGFKIVKASMPEVSEDIDFELSLTEYFNACVDNGVAQPNLVASPLKGQYGSISSNGGYNMGIAFDGEYVYYGLNTSGNKQIVVYKATPDGTIVANSATFDVSNVDGDNARLFIKDGTLDAIGRVWERTVGEGDEATKVTQGPVYSIRLEDFKQGCEFTEDDSLPFDESGAPFSAAWNEANQKFVVLNTGRWLYVVNEEGESLASVHPEISGFGTSSVTCDDNYIYVSYCINGQKSIPVRVYDWSLNLVYEMTVKGEGGADIGLGPGVGTSYNAQCICVVDGVIYVSLSKWSGSENMAVWVIKPDMSVFGN